MYLTFPTNRAENQPLRPGRELDLPAVPELTRLGPRPERHPGIPESAALLSTARVNPLPPQLLEAPSKR